MLRYDEVRNDVSAGGFGGITTIMGKNAAPVFKAKTSELETSITVEGELTYLHLREIRNSLKKLLPVVKEKKSFIFDFAECGFVDSGCMGLLVEFKKELDKRDSEMKIINVQRTVEEAMKRIGMGKIINITGTKK